MKLLKFGLRFWIALTSVASFMVGWAMLAHSPKPIQPSVSSITTLAPLPPLNFNAPVNGFDNSPRVITQSRSPFFPSFRTGGS